MFLFEAVVFNLIFGFIPDTAGIFILGLVIIFSTAILRWLLNYEKRKTDN